MKDSTRNEFLDRISVRLKRRRPHVPPTWNYSCRVESIAGTPFVSIWFRTRGCKHDHMGGCTMCNYGVSSAVSADAMIEYVRSGIEQLPDYERMNLLVSPSGSMLDEWEVPAQAREGIFRLVRETNCVHYYCETRAETITESKIGQYSEILDTKVRYIEIGLESANPWIARSCVNKALSLRHYAQSVQLLHRYGVFSAANIVVGSPFLSQSEAVADAVQTVRWAITNGTDSCVVFPVHVKQWTLVEWLWKHDLYSPISLWSLVEVLARLGPELAPKVTISWYKTYNEQTAWGEPDPKDDLGYLASPGTCLLCQPKVMNLLDAYRDTNDYAVVQELVNLKCTCKDSWRAEFEAVEPQSLVERVSHAYEAIGRGVLGTGWWNENGDVVLADLA